MSGLHPFDPITPGEIQLATKLLQTALPGVDLRYKRIDLQEPIKKDVIPYIEAERLGKPLPPKPARLLVALFHRLDTGAFCKALLNASTRAVVSLNEMPKDIQVHYSRLRKSTDADLTAPGRRGRNDRNRTTLPQPPCRPSRDR